jgi:ABC-type transport system involved in cytochrome c biogenesis permease subunit
MKRFNLLAFLIIILVFVKEGVAQTGTGEIKPLGVKSVQSLADVPILENGRIKPLDTFARNLLLRFSGKTSYEKTSALSWVIKLLFAPDLTRDDKIFLINHPDIIESLGLEPEKKRRYSLNQLEPALEKLTPLAASAQKIDPKDRDIAEQEVIRLFENLQLYARLSFNFSFAFPHVDFRIKDPQNLQELKLPDHVKQFSYLDLALRAEQLQSLIKPLEQKPPHQWTNADREIFQAINNLFQWTQFYHDLPLPMIPDYRLEKEDWYSPWDIAAIALTIPQGRDEMVALRDMMAAYWNGQQISFDLAVKTFKHSVLKRLKESNPHILKSIPLELWYNNLQLLAWAKVFYLFIFFLFLLALAHRKSWYYKIAWGFLALGGGLHALSLLMRITIMQRPPVTSLYETFIFVSFVIFLAGTIIEKVHRQWLGLVIASLGGAIFLTIAEKFASEGDTLQMLVAVLNSNFWLGTHVLSITTGYAGICAAGIIGHVYLLQSIFQRNNKPLLDSTSRILLGTLGFGLTMTFLGTNLGGIWADQSWGRFWGWDPKENGALMIVLWTALLFHLRVGKMIGSLGLAVGSILGIMVVMWAWFGVNLLSVGLHSYGFTSGLATNLMIYGIIQMLFILIAYPLARHKIR